MNGEKMSEAYMLYKEEANGMMVINSFLKIII